MIRTKSENGKRKAGRLARRNKQRGLWKTRLIAFSRATWPRLLRVWRLWPAVILVVLIVLLHHDFTRADRFRLRTIDLPDCRHLTKTALLNYLHFRTGQNVFTIDLHGAAKRIYDHPWVKTASVRRELPDTVVVELTEREPVALLRMETLYLVDEDGVPFKKAEAGDPGDLPLLSGFDPTAFQRGGLAARRMAKLIAEAAHLIRTGQRIGHLDPQDISEVRYEASGGYTFVTADHGAQIRLGFGDYDKKLQRFAAVSQRIGGRMAQVRLVDVSIPGRVVVRGLRQESGA
jgi:cell division protein FtsQ